MSGSWLLPLPAVIPLVGAALATAVGCFTSRLVHSLIALAATAASFVFAVLVLVQSVSQERLHWFGGWTPRGGVAIGIAFTSDPLGAGMAVLASGLTLASLLYSLAFLEEWSRQYHVLTCAFGGAMCGFALTGDLFNMFVWFELTGVAAYALAGFKVGEIGTLQGAINFAVTNTIGAYLILVGIALLYARTGALNLAQIGHTLAGRRAGGAEIVALTLLTVGFLVRAAIVPFHFWLADAHSVAPASVCVLFSGAMVQLGLLGVARCYWTIFDAPFGAHPTAIRDVLVAAGLVTALLGAQMAFLQSHLKRLLAYSTISYAGAVLVGIGLLDSRSLAGAAELVLSHGLLKSGLFFAAGVVFVKHRGIDEQRLFGRGRRDRVLAALFLLAALGLAGPPYVGTFLAYAQLDGVAWIAPLLMLASGLSTAAILRAGARIFLGWGSRDDALLAQQPAEEPAHEYGHHKAMIAVTGVLVALGLAASLVPGLAQRAESGAERFRDRAAYANRVLHGEPTAPAARVPFAVAPTSTGSVLYGLGGTAIALAIAAFGLWRPRPGAHAAAPPLRILHAVHSGVIGDYVMWLTLGAALLGGVWALTLR